jgi:hypothetical protein
MRGQGEAGERRWERERERQEVGIKESNLLERDRARSTKMALENDTYPVSRVILNTNRAQGSLKHWKGAGMNESVSRPERPSVGRSQLPYVCEGAS